MPPKKKAKSDEQPNFGKAVAETLLKEINPPEMGASGKDDTLMTPPERKDLSFVVKDGEDFAKIELNLFEPEELGVKKHGKKAICLSSGFVGEKGFFDIDHVYPFKGIRENQIELLAELNKNEKFAKAFMGEEPSDKILQDSIGKYFGRDPVTNEIKGKWRFFRACYNDKDNLMLLTGFINSSKNATTPEEWARNQKMLGPDCEKDIKNAGGTHQGVILQKIFNSIGVKKYKIGNAEVFLHKDVKTVEGLGAFINRWCSSNRKEFIDFCRKEQNLLIKEIQKISDKILKKEVGAEVQAEKILVSLSATVKTLEKLYDINKGESQKEGSVSGSDTASQEVRRDKAQGSFTKMAKSYMHEFKKIQAAIAADPHITAQEAERLLNVFDSLNIESLSVKDRSNFFINFGKRLRLRATDGKEIKLAVVNLKGDEIEREMRKAEEESNSEKIAAASKVETEEERAAKERVLAENAILKGRIAALEQAARYQQQCAGGTQQYAIGADGKQLRLYRGMIPVTERAVGEKDFRNEPAEELKGAKTEGESQPPRPQSPHNS